MASLNIEPKIQEFKEFRGYKILIPHEINGRRTYVYEVFDENKNFIGVQRTDETN